MPQRMRSRRVNNWVKGPRVRIQPCHFCSFFSASVIKKYHDEKKPGEKRVCLADNFKLWFHRFREAKPGTEAPSHTICKVESAKEWMLPSCSLAYLLALFTLPQLSG